MGRAICGEGETHHIRKGKEQTFALGSPHGKDKYPWHLALKVRGAEFREFLQPKGLKAWNFKNQWARFWESPEANRRLSPLPQGESTTKSPQK